MQRMWEVKLHSRHVDSYVALFTNQLNRPFREYCFWFPPFLSFFFSPSLRHFGPSANNCHLHTLNCCSVLLTQWPAIFRCVCPIAQLRLRCRRWQRMNVASRAHRKKVCYWVNSQVITNSLECERYIHQRRRAPACLERYSTIKKRYFAEKENLAKAKEGRREWERDYTRRKEKDNARTTGRNDDNIDKEGGNLCLSDIDSCQRERASLLSAPATVVMNTLFLIFCLPLSSFSKRWLSTLSLRPETE